VWRALAIVAIVAVTVAMARFLSRPPSPEGEGRGAGVPDESFVATTSPGELPADHPKRTQSENNLRNLLGLLINAEEDPNAYEDPRNKDPKAREEFLAERFGLAMPLLPHSNLPAGFLPDGAQVLAAFDDSQGGSGRMVLVRIKDTISGSLAAFGVLYEGQGWQRFDPPETGRQADRGWLVRFRQKGKDRYVYARPASREGETLVAIFDAPH
jgi:hypothetical protein